MHSNIHNIIVYFYYILGKKHFCGVTKFTRGEWVSESCYCLLLTIKENKLYLVHGTIKDDSIFLGTIYKAFNLCSLMLGITDWFWKIFTVFDFWFILDAYMMASNYVRTLLLLNQFGNILMSSNLIRPNSPPYTDGPAAFIFIVVFPSFFFSRRYYMRNKEDAAGKIVPYS